MTNQEVIDRARRGLKDKFKRRITDPDALKYLEDFILWLYNNRPDWFIGQYSAIPTAGVIGATYPVDDRTVPMAGLYIAARAEFPDDQNVAEGRFVTALGMLKENAFGN